MMNASSCQAASLIVGSDKSLILIRRLLPASLLVGRGIEASWRGQGMVGRYKTVSPLNDHIITWIAEVYSLGI